MRILYLSIFTLSFLTVDLVLADPFKPMNLPINEKITLKFRFTAGKEKSIIGREKFPEFQEISIKKISKDEKEYYEIIKKSKLFNGQSTESRSLIEIGEFLKTIEFNLKRKNQKEKEIDRVHTVLDDPSWKYPADIYTENEIDFLFRSLIHQNIKESNFHLRLADEVIMKVKLKVIKKEQIHVPLGDYMCFKIRMEPDIRSFVPMPQFIASIIQPLMPKFYFWFWEKEPYPLIKSDGQMGLLGSPRAISEIEKYENYENLK